MKYGFIGLGNMASAIIKGMINSNEFDATQIYGLNRSPEKTNKLVAQLNIQATESIQQLVNAVDVIVLAVKPQNLEEVLPSIRESLRPGQMIISIAAGKTLTYFAENLSNEHSIFRVMPNINAVIGASTSCYSTFSTGTEEKKIVENLFSKVGTIIELPESQFSTFTTIGCASPAFTYLYIDSLARAAVLEGMPKDLALQIAASSVLGSAKMILESGQHPWSLIDQVCSPGGTTIRGVTALQHNQFESAIYNAVTAVSNRDKELDQK